MGGLFWAHKYTPRQEEKGGNEDSSEATDTRDRSNGTSEAEKNKNKNKKATAAAGDGTSENEDEGVSGDDLKIEMTVDLDGNNVLEGLKQLTKIGVSSKINEKILKGILFTYLTICCFILLSYPTTHITASYCSLISSDMWKSNNLTIFEWSQLQ